MSKKLFIDFDDVTFHSAWFSKDLRKIYLHSGVSQKVNDITYQNYFLAQKSEIKFYNIWEHIDQMEEYSKKDLTQMRKRVKKFLRDTSKYIFPDALDLFKKIGKENIFIVSHGKVGSQSEKIINSGVGNYVQAISVTKQLKSYKITKLVKKYKIDPQKEKVYFVDDRMVQIEDVKKKNPKIITMLVRRPESRYRDQEHKNEYSDFEIESLSYDLFD